MSIKIKLILPLILLFIIGCSYKNHTIDYSVASQNILPYTPANVVVGNKNSAQYKLSFVRIEDSKQIQTIEFYIDFLPYNIDDIDLCKDQDKKIVTSITNKNGKITTESNQSFSCNGYIHLTNDNDKYYMSTYEFNFLTGYHIEKINGYDMKLPVRQFISGSGGLIKKDGISNQTSRYDDSEGNIVSGSYFIGKVLK